MNDLQEAFYSAASLLGITHPIETRYVKLASLKASVEKTIPIGVIGTIAYMVAVYFPYVPYGLVWETTLSYLISLVAATAAYFLFSRKAKSAAEH